VCGYCPCVPVVLVLVLVWSLSLVCICLSSLVSFVPVFLCVSLSCLQWLRLLYQFGQWGNLCHCLVMLCYDDVLVCCSY
jgi:di/tricarboxylate transporter